MRQLFNPGHEKPAVYWRAREHTGRVVLPVSSHADPAPPPDPPPRCSNSLTAQDIWDARVARQPTALALGGSVRAACCVPRGRQPAGVRVARCSPHADWALAVLAVDSGTTAPKYRNLPSASRRGRRRPGRADACPGTADRHARGRARAGSHASRVRASGRLRRRRAAQADLGFDRACPRRRARRSRNWSSTAGRSSRRWRIGAGRYADRQRSRCRTPTASASSSCRCCCRARRWSCANRSSRTSCRPMPSAYDARMFAGVPFMFDYFLANPPATGWPASAAHADFRRRAADAVDRPRLLRPLRRSRFTRSTARANPAASPSTTSDTIWRRRHGRPAAARRDDHALVPDGRALPEEQRPRPHSQWQACRRIRRRVGWRASATTDSSPATTARSTPMDGSVLTGRVSSFINVAGKKVQPAEVEDVLRTMPGVRDVRVLAAADPQRGEQVAACIVRDRTDPAALDARRAQILLGATRAVQDSRASSSSSMPSR